MWVNIGLVKVEQPKQQGKVEIGGFSPYKADINYKTFCRFIMEKVLPQIFILLCPNKVGKT